MSNLLVRVWSSRNVTWIALTRNGGLVILMLGPRTNESLKEAALLAKGVGGRLFCDNRERCPNSVLNMIKSQEVIT